MKGSTSARGYGYAHQQERKRRKAEVDAGQAFCCRCGRPIHPNSRWNLDHAPGKRGYRGVAHELCNKSAGGKVGAAVTNGKRAVRRRVSRRW